MTPPGSCLHPCYEVLDKTLVGRCNSFIGFYVHISTGSSMITFVAMLVLTVTSFCIVMLRLRVLTGQLLAEILRTGIRDDDFRVPFMMAEVCQRQN